jgi:hypothetical protein
MRLKDEECIVLMSFLSLLWLYHQNSQATTRRLLRLKKRRCYLRNVISKLLISQSGLANNVDIPDHSQCQDFD